MPFRRAHLAVPLLFPLVLVAFWPGYFGQLRAASAALHAHGLLATGWIALAAFQTWSIAARRVAWHRAAGLLTFGLVPAFSAASLLVMRDMARLGLARADPFHAAFGVPLAVLDAVTLPAFLYLVGLALAERRRVALHAGAMLASLVLVLPPVLGRLAGQLLPPALTDGWPALGFHVGQLAAAVLALRLARLEPRAARPFRFAAALLAVEAVLLETAVGSPAWAAAAGAATRVPGLLVALFGVTASAAVLWSAWHRPAERERVPAPSLSMRVQPPELTPSPRA